MAEGMHGGDSGCLHRGSSAPRGLRLPTWGCRPAPSPVSLPSVLPGSGTPAASPFSHRRPQIPQSHPSAELTREDHGLPPSLRGAPASLAACLRGGGSQLAPPPPPPHCHRPPPHCHHHTATATPPPPHRHRPRPAPFGRPRRREDPPRGPRPAPAPECQPHLGTL